MSYIPLPPLRTASNDPRSEPFRIPLSLPDKNEEGWLIVASKYGHTDNHCRVELPSSPSIQPMSTASPCTETSALRSRKRHLSDYDSNYSRSKRPRGVGDGRQHAVSDTLSIPTKMTCIDFGQTFKIPNPVSTSPPDTTSFYLDFFDPPSFMGYSDPGEFCYFFDRDLR